MVAVKSREERFIVTGKAQTIQSKVEKGFRLEVPERSLPARSHVVLKVLFQEAMQNHKRSLNIIKMLLGMSCKQKNPFINAILSLLSVGGPLYLRNI